jgi:Na+-driven multidrug efflux pump
MSQFLALTQPINSLAFVFDGLHYGASDFSYAAYSMMLLAVPSALILLFCPKLWGLPGVWVGMTVVMFLRMVSGLGAATGPWKFLRQ